jgi:inner membrane protein
MQRAMLWKVVSIVVLCLLALIPLSIVRGIVAERQALRDSVIAEFASETVGPQIIKGPVLMIPYRKTFIETTEERASAQAVAIEIKRKKTVEGRLFFLPEAVDLVGHAGIQERRRGIYTAQAYDGVWQMKGHFEIPAHFGVGADFTEYAWGTPELGFGIGDPRGLAPGVTLSVNGKAAMLEAGTSLPGLGRGVHATVDTTAMQNGTAKSFEFVLDMSLAGLNRVKFLPMGRTSTVKFIRAFSGRCWPSTRSTTKGSAQSGERLSSQAICTMSMPPVSRAAIAPSLTRSHSVFRWSSRPTFISNWSDRSSTDCCSSA